MKSLLFANRSKRCVRVPKDIYGRDFADHLIRRWDFREVRQTGSHIILRTETPFGYTVSVPAHKPVRPGTLSDILHAVAEHKGATVNDILNKF
jgi:predicted RNA binding protein YcfA (HicA-like mRNA interferase family)